ncbi:HIT domain-containing protein [Bifidobacterium sp. W8108]|uniref:HIT domain-containing protein n=1 Tax=Bifidobacterium sp. M0307 TaxID=2751017 RepID=UPI0018DB09E9|nr:HIT domain-containing protein [Bifidobacterium sp. W8108]MBI0173431.1 HIT domain-containing protein [Bifidobacterium sp. M0307]
MHEVYRDEEAVAFFPTELAVLGHTLVISRRHVPVVWELPEDEAQHLGLLISCMSRVIGETVNAEVSTIIQVEQERRPRAFFASISTLFRGDLTTQLDVSGRLRRTTRSMPKTRLGTHCVILAGRFIYDETGSVRA